MQTIHLFHCNLCLLFLLLYCELYASTLLCYFFSMRIHLRLYNSGIVVLTICLYCFTLLLLYACTSLRMYTSTPLRLYTSTPLRLYASTPLHLYPSTPLPLYTCTFQHLYASTPLRLYTSTCTLLRLVLGIEV